MGWGKWIDSDALASASTTSDCSQSVPSSPANTRCASRFDVPDALESQAIPRAKTPTGDAPSKPTVSTAVSMPPPRKSSKRRQTFLSDSPGPSGDELPPPAVLLSSSGIAVPPDPVSPKKSPKKTAAKPAAVSREKGAGKKASSSTADKQATRARDASRAGRLRGVVGSG
jgi:hypothetical protein